MSTVEIQPTESQAIVAPNRLLEIALNNHAAIDVIERLAALQEKQLSKESEREFNEALGRCQSEIPRIIPDLNNPNSKKKYASYEALDKAIRPVYLKHGFSLSFSTADCPNPEKVRTVCRCSHEGGHAQFYQIDITADGSGPKGGGMLTRPHADLAANTLGIRRLLRMIFNIVDTAEDELLTNGWLIEKLDWMENCRTLPELTKVFTAAFNEATEQKNSRAMLALVQAKDKKKKELK
jgi:hypothetical protein